MIIIDIGQDIIRGTFGSHQSQFPTQNIVDPTRISSTKQQERHLAASELPSLPLNAKAAPFKSRLNNSGKSQSNSLQNLQ